MTDAWTPLTDELDRWQQTGKTAPFWLRDDDAVEPTEALARLLALTEQYEISATLAVIPAHTGQPLADFIAGRPSLDVAVHGWAHGNHAGPDEKKQELGPQRPADTVLRELKAGIEKLQMLYGARLTPMLVPPWNRIAASLIPALAGLGFQALSVYGPEKPGPLPLINTHVDLMDWHGTRGGRETPALVADIVKRLRQMFETGGTMGFLTHHLVHDAAAWNFLDGLFAVTTRHPACYWVRSADMLAQRRTDIENLPLAR
jgi:hypothetical protein